jgi:hypothetical protein
MALLFPLAVFLSLGATASTLVASVMVSRLDFLVHNDLYQYGLFFSQEWATPYTEFIWSVQTSLTIAATLSGVSTILILISFVRHVSEKESPVVGMMKVITILFIAVANGLIVFSLFVLSRLDFLVHNDLYQYGLIFSQEWATPYWQNLFTIQSLLMTATGLGLGISVIIVRSKLPDEGIHISLERTWLFPMVLGLATLGFAFFIDSSILAIVGLGSTLCGLILRFLTEERYTRKLLLDAAVASQIVSLEKMVKDSRLQDRVAVYLPPKYLTNGRENKVHLTPQLDKLLLQTDSSTISPPGDAIVKILEDRLQKSFVEVDLPFLEKNLPSLLSEFEIAERVEMRVLGNNIIVEMQNCIYVDGSRDIMQSSTATRSLGSPVTSAIACALAKAIAKPIIVSNEVINMDVLKAEYTVVGENAQ